MLIPVVLSAGSPPHTRGASAVTGQPADRAGITPAYAGSISGGNGVCRGCRDHPRIRGEHAQHWTDRRRTLGSPPHTRGASFLHFQNSSASGITPAYAGSIPVKRRPSRQKKDHPRIRGEHPSSRLHNCISKGSPPHTRGAFCDNGCRYGFRGITPAYAGSILSVRKSPSFTRDHPRIRGEHGGCRVG